MDTDHVLLFNRERLNQLTALVLLPQCLPPNVPISIADLLKTSHNPFLSSLLPHLPLLARQALNATYGAMQCPFDMDWAALWRADPYQLVALLGFSTVLEPIFVHHFPAELREAAVHTALKCFSTVHGCTLDVAISAAVLGLARISEPQESILKAFIFKSLGISNQVADMIEHYGEALIRAGAVKALIDIIQAGEALKDIMRRLNKFSPNLRFVCELYGANTELCDPPRRPLSQENLSLVLELPVPYTLRCRALSLPVPNAQPRLLPSGNYAEDHAYFVHAVLEHAPHLLRSNHHLALRAAMLLAQYLRLVLLNSPYGDLAFVSYAIEQLITLTPAPAPFYLISSPEVINYLYDNPQDANTYQPLLPSCDNLGSHDLRYALAHHLIHPALVMSAVRHTFHVLQELLNNATSIFGDQMEAEYYDAWLTRYLQSPNWEQTRAVASQAFYDKLAQGNLFPPGMFNIL